MVPRRSKVTEAERDQRLEEWAATSGVDVGKLEAGQRWIIYAVLTFLAYAQGFAPLRRMVAYLLCHCGIGLSTAMIGAVVGTTGRAVRNSQQYAPVNFWKRLRSFRRGHPPPKLRREQVGQVAKFLARNKRCSVAELLAFIKEQLGVEVDRLTLRRFLKRYGLGCLREEEVADSPLLSATLRTAGHSP